MSWAEEETETAAMIRSAPIPDVFAIGVNSPRALRQAVLCLSFATLPFFAGCSDPIGASQAPDAESFKQVGLLAVSSPRIDLGTVERGGKKEATFWLTNTTSEPVEITNIEYSCVCLDLNLLAPRTIAPDERHFVCAKLEMSREPDFIGDLAVEVWGRTADKRVAFYLVLNADVRKESHRSAFNFSKEGGDI